MIEPVLSKILELARSQGAEAEVFYLEQAETPVDFESNRLKSLETKALQGVALRVIAAGKLGFASSTDLTQPEKLVEAALQTSAIGDPCAIDFAEPTTLAASTQSDYTAPAVSTLVAQGKTWIDALKTANPDLMVSAGFSLRNSKRVIATTHGAYLEQAGQTLGASLGANWVRGEDLLDVYSYQFVREEEPDYSAMLLEVQTKLARATQMASIESGTLPVIFTPNAAAAVFGGLFRTIFSGQSVVQKSSPLTDKVGQHLFDPRLSVYEDPTSGPGRTAVDDEGTATQQKFFIRNGVIESFYWDRTWAERGGVTSTGNGFRGGLSRPGARPVNVCLSAGDATFAQMVASIKTGLIVDQVLGAGQSNQLAGEFSVNLDLGYKVENGEIVGRVKNTMVAGNLFTAGQALEVIGSECEWVFGSTLMPPLLFRELGVASRS